MSFKNKLEIQKNTKEYKRKSRKIYITKVDWKLIFKILSEPITLGKKTLKTSSQISTSAVRHFWSMGRPPIQVKQWVWGDSFHLRDR